MTILEMSTFSHHFLLLTITILSLLGNDLYHPNACFYLYPLTSDCLRTGDAGEGVFSELFFGGDIYSNGEIFRLSVNDDKTTIRLGDKFLSVTLGPDNAKYLPEGCRQHNAWSKCP